MSGQNSTQEVNEWENQWIVLSQICMAWQGTARREENRIVMGLQNHKLLEQLQLDPNLTLEKATNLVRQERDGETTTKRSWWRIQVYPSTR